MYISYTASQDCTYTVHVMCHVEDDVAPFNEVGPGQAHYLEESQSQLVNNNNEAVQNTDENVDQSSVTTSFPGLPAAASRRLAEPVVGSCCV